VIDAGSDPELGRGKDMLARLPPGPLRVVLRTAAWLTSDLNLDLTRLGMPRQAFGGAMITSVGGWGITRAYSPLAHYYRVPLLVLVGAVRPQPAAVADEVVVRPVLTLTATFGHRYADGFHAARFAGAGASIARTRPRSSRLPRRARGGGGRPSASLSAAG
jgi:hypothetical protein